MPRRQGAVSQRRQKVSRVWKELEEAARNGGDDESLLRDVLDRLEQLTPDADVVNALRPNGNRETILAFCAGQGFPDCVRFLLQRGADPDIRDNDGRSPLYYAAARGTAYKGVLKSADAVARLINAGADLESDKEGLTEALKEFKLWGPVLQSPTLGGPQKLPVQAVEPFARALLSEQPILFAEEARRDPGLFRRALDLLQRSGLTTATYHYEEGEHMSTFLHAAACAGCAESVEALLAAGADVNAVVQVPPRLERDPWWRWRRGDDGWLSFWNRQERIPRRNFTGCSALTLAVVCGAPPRVLALLIDGGADVNNAAADSVTSSVEERYFARPLNCLLSKVLGDREWRGFAAAVPAAAQAQMLDLLLRGGAEPPREAKYGHEWTQSTFRPLAWRPLENADAGDKFVHVARSVARLLRDRRAPWEQSVEHLNEALRWWVEAAGLSRMRPRDNVGMYHAGAVDSLTVVRLLVMAGADARLAAPIWAHLCAANSPVPTTFAEARRRLTEAWAAPGVISFLREQSGRLGFGGARGLLLRPRLAAAAEAGGAAAAEEAPPEAYGVVADPARIELDLGSGGHVLHLEHLQEQREKLRRLQAEAAAAAAAPRAPRRRPRKPQRGGAQAASGVADAAAAALAKAAAELDQEELRRRARILCEVVCLFQVRQDANALEQRSGGDGEEYVPARPALPQPQPVPLPRQDLFSSARLEAAEKARAAMAARAAEWGGKKVIVKPRGIAEDPEGREWMEVDAETLCLFKGIPIIERPAYSVADDAHPAVAGVPDAASVPALLLAVREFAPMYLAAVNAIRREAPGSEEREEAKKKARSEVDELMGALSPEKLTDLIVVAAQLECEQLLCAAMNRAVDLMRAAPLSSGRNERDGGGGRWQAAVAAAKGVKRKRAGGDEDKRALPLQQAQQALRERGGGGGLPWEAVVRLAEEMLGHKLAAEAAARRAARERAAQMVGHGLVAAAAAAVPVAAQAVPPVALGMVELSAAPSFAAMSSAVLAAWPTLAAAFVAGAVGGQAAAAARGWWRNNKRRNAAVPKEEEVEDDSPKAAKRARRA